MLFCVISFLLFTVFWIILIFKISPANDFVCLIKFTSHFFFLNFKLELLWFCSKLREVFIVWSVYKFLVYQILAYLYIPTHYHRLHILFIKWLLTYIGLHIMANYEFFVPFSPRTLNSIFQHYISMVYCLKIADIPVYRIPIAVVVLWLKVSIKFN